MNKLLHSLIDLTSRRERTQIDSGLVSALYDSTGAAECALFGISCSQGSARLALQAQTTGGVTTVPAPDQSAVTQPLAAFALLAAGIEAHANQVIEPLADGRIATWMPLWVEGSMQASACVRLVSSARLTPGLLDEVQGLLAVYRNFTSLLDDNERDSLTGLLNRKTFDRRFSELVGTAIASPRPHDLQQPERRSGEAVTAHWLGVIDIDHFKKVNDQFGHVYGDEVLILLANILKASFRNEDRVYRFGGEEFVVLLRATTVDDAKKSFERLRARVEAHEFPQIKQVTISLGFASITQETPVTILGHADQALYYAKEHGRNQVCFYDELAAGGQIGSLVVHQDVEFF